MPKQRTKIPEGWRETTLDEVCENLDNLRRPVSQNLREPGNIPYYGATGIVDYVKDYIFDEELLLVGEDGADWSKFASAAYIIKGKSWVNNHAHILRCKKSNIVYLQNYLNFIGLDNYISGSTRGKLTKGVLMNIKILLPPLSAQNKIAEILGAVDEEIEKTDKIIEETEKIKKGILVEKFFINKEYNYKLLNLGELCEIINGKTPLRSDYTFWDNGTIPWFTIDDIRRQGRIITETRQKITQKAVNETKIKISPSETVLLCCTASIGEYAYSSIPLSTNQQFNALVIKDKTQLYPKFLFYFISTLGKKLNSIKGTTTIGFISTKKISEIKISLPPLSVQKQVVGILSAVDNKILNYQKIKNNLIQLKKGLMVDLLSGKKITYLIKYLL